MLIIGLTGGIGSGKSQACHYFSQLGIPVIDADVIAKKIVNNDQSILKAIKTRFGVDYINKDGDLDRKKLRAHIFNNLEDKKWLETLLHPLIMEQILKEVEHKSAPYCIVAIPLLFETGPFPFLDRILVIDAPEVLQIERAMARDNSSLQEIKAIINQQIEREQRIAQADDIIVNDNDLDNLSQKIAAMHDYYLTLKNTKNEMG